MHNAKVPSSNLKLYDTNYATDTRNLRTIEENNSHLKMVISLPDVKDSICLVSVRVFILQTKFNLQYYLIT